MEEQMRSTSVGVWTRTHREDFSYVFAGLQTTKSTLYQSLQMGNTSIRHVMSLHTKQVKVKYTTHPTQSYPKKSKTEGRLGDSLSNFVLNDSSVAWFNRSVLLCSDKYTRFGICGNTRPSARIHMRRLHQTKNLSFPLNDKSLPKLLVLL